MTALKKHILLIAGAILTCTGCDSKQAAVNTADNEATANAATADHSDPIESAMSAGPRSIAGDATIMKANADGSMTTLREGKNGWMCLPDSPTTPGPDPMCMDANAAKWAMAWMAHKPPPANTVGVMYMLEGGTDASNSDPYATAPSPDNDWVKTGPHIMIVGSQELLKGHPSGGKPETNAPYVMWAGTPYAHLMVPVG
jgi:hypothetical protein